VSALLRFIGMEWPIRSIANIGMERPVRSLVIVEGGSIIISADPRNSVRHKLIVPRQAP
jgi:hypothetical protein